MTINQLHYVITVAEAGSLNRAAHILYISQPSLTSSIKELENELGILIFNRSGRGVTLTNDGAEFLLYAKQVYEQYEGMLEKYGRIGARKKKFAVSAQHYSFAVKAFVELVKKFDAQKYEFAMRETKTRDVIDDVSTLKSEIGVLYLSNFNRKVMLKLIDSANLKFYPLTECDAFVYLWKKHPLAKEKSIRFSQLAAYPSLSFEQGDNASFYFAEEILATADYPCTIRANDRATMLNLMVGLNAFILCSGIICEELNGDDFVAVPFEPDADTPGDVMQIGYVVRKDTLLSDMGKMYIEELRDYLGIK